MPELPEVQTIVNDLNKKVLGRKITGLWFDWPKAINLLENKKGVLKLISAKGGSLPAGRHGSFGGKKLFIRDFEKIIKNKKIIKARRKAKNILIDLSDGYLMLVHQKMTGHLLVGKWKMDNGKIVALEPQSVVNDLYNRFVHIIFYLDNGKMLALSDMRKFAKIILGKKEDIENLPEIKDLGPEPLDKSFKFDDFKKIISVKTGKIKQVLMDPKAISGIGNIYSDDILWAAKTNPFKPANKISENKLQDIFKAIKKILEKAVRLRGTSVSDFRDTAGKKGRYGNMRLVYQREGEKCPRKDRGIIVRKKIGGRSAHYCPVCQK